MQINLASLRDMATRAELPELAELVAFFSGDQADRVDWAEVSDDPPLSFASVTYLDRFRQRLLELGRYDATEVSEIMRHARAYAGGVARHAAPEQDPDPQAASELWQHDGVMSVSGMTFAEGKLTPWMQITPSAGSKFEHPKYGTVPFTRQLAEEMKANFASGIYQEHIPIDAEHQTKLSGALGYYRELRMRGDGALEARVELNERGQALKQNFKYFSPEFFRSWKDPATGQEHKNLLVGGAFTSRPFFKDRYLAPLAASEQYTVWEPPKGAKMGRYKRNDKGDLELDENGEPILTSEALEADAQAADAADQETHAAFMEMMGKRKKKMKGMMPMSEEDSAAGFMEFMKRKRKGHKMSEAELDTFLDGLVTAREPKDPPKGEPATFAEQFPDHAQKFDEMFAENKRLHAEARTQRFTDLVRGRGGDGDGRPWMGETEKHVGHLVRLSEAFGEDSDDVQWYIGRERDHAEQTARGALFSQRGAEGPGNNTSEDAAVAAATARMKANPELSFAEALDQELTEQPQIYADAVQDD